jgi:nucleotide-binding universal stress UspA family protein
MLKVLIPIDGSQNANRAVDHALKLAQAGKGLEIQLLNVQIPVASGHARMFVSDEQLSGYYREEGLAALKEARERLDGLGVSYRYHIGVGHVAETIAEYAKQNQCEAVIMGTRGMGAISNLVLGSIASRVIHLTDLPVTLVK